MPTLAHGDDLGVRARVVVAAVAVAALADAVAVGIDEHRADRDLVQLVLGLIGHGEGLTHPGLVLGIGRAGDGLGGGIHDDTVS